MLDFFLELLLDEVRRHPVVTLLAIWAMVRLFGVTVQTGWAGVLFRLGRVTKELGPGFHFLIPIVHQVRRTPVRSITLDLPRQRVTTADGLVYAVDSSLVYRISDPLRALIQVDDVHKGCSTLLPLAVQQVLSGQTRSSLQERKSLDEELTAKVQEMLAGWGVQVEQAGFTSIAPTRKTLRLTQLPLRSAERERVLQSYVAAGLSPRLALTLLGASRRLVGHAHARYRVSHRKPVRRASVVVEQVSAILAPLDETGASFSVVREENGIMSTTGAYASSHRKLQLMIGATQRVRLTSRRPIAKIIVEKDSPVRVSVARDDPTAVEITALKAPWVSQEIVLGDNTGGYETVQLTVESW